MINRIHTGIKVFMVKPCTFLTPLQHLFCKSFTQVRLCLKEKKNHLPVYENHIMYS